MKTSQYLWLFLLLVCFSSFIYAKTDSIQIDSMSKVLNEVSILRERQDLIIDAAQRDLNRMYIIFAIVAGYFGLFSIFVAFRQVINDNNRSKLDKQGANESKEIMTAFKENINTISALIRTLEGTISYREKVDELKKEIIILRESETKKQNTFMADVNVLNEKSIYLFSLCQLDKSNRAVFKNEINKKELTSFSSEYASLSKVGNIKDYINPISLYLLGLNDFNDIKYEKAIYFLKESRELANNHLINLKNKRYECYAKLGVDLAKDYLEVIVKEVSYHLGILNYNLGKYAAAQQEFSHAYKKDALDFRSKIYIPELMFFDGDSKPSIVKAEFDLVENEILKIPSTLRELMHPSWGSYFASLKMRQGSFYLPKDDLLRPIERAKWKEFEDSEKAFQCHEKAYENDKSNPIVKFSFAQAIRTMNATTTKKSDNYDLQLLYRESFEQFTSDIIHKTESILLALLNYSAAICCFEGDIENEKPRDFLNKSRLHLKGVPESIYIFSPINRINRPPTELVKEMNILEQKVWKL